MKRNPYSSRLGALVITGICACGVVHAAEPTPISSNCTVDADSIAASPAALDSYNLHLDYEMTIDVLATIDKDEKVADTSVAKSSRNRLVDRAAMTAAKRWRYHCQATPGTALLTVRIPAPHCKLDMESWREHRPVYPEQLRHNHAKGSVDLSLRPGGIANGTAEVSLKTSSGYTDADNAVLDAARKWRFSCDSPSSPRQTAFTTEQFNFSDRPSQEELEKLERAERAKRKIPPFNSDLKTTVRDTLPMEYVHAKPFFESVPKQNDVELSKDQQDTPGLKVYTTSLKKVMEQILASDQLEQPKVTTWLMFMPPHPWAPAVIRTRSETITDEASIQRRPITRVNYVCDSSPANCAQIESRISHMVEPVSATH
ncbi:TonB family protein [Xanthomonas sp. WHRI 6106]|uniref:TonB family protein n=1 Tax=Xanthomonas sp. WHRI 6106 TaxID=3161566 RepID=UPI0032E888CC